jgi:hypothetical protein
VPELEGQCHWLMTSCRNGLHLILENYGRGALSGGNLVHAPLPHGIKTDKLASPARYLPL